MRWVTVAWLAFLNMLRTAARDPHWAVTALILAPVRAIVYLVEHAAPVAVLVCLTTLGLYAVMKEAGIQRGDILWFVGNGIYDAFLLLLPVCIIGHRMIIHFASVDTETHGSARFATRSDMAPYTGNAGLLIGRDRKSGKLLRYNGPAHLVTMAPTRTGKGVGTIIPNLLTAGRSVVCIDPKGENVRVSRRARERFGEVHVLDPFGVTGQRSAAFNPLDAIDPAGIDAAEDVSTLADALVVDEPGMSGEAHWNEETKALITGLILTIITDELRSRRTLSTLREYLTLPPDRFAELLKRMQENEGVGGLIARAANRHLGKSDREAAGVLSAAQRHTHFLDSARMAAVLAHSDFAFADLKSRSVTVFLVLPPKWLGAYSRWLRLLVGQSLMAMANTTEAPHSPVLYLLDEFAALGHLAAVERAMGLMAGYGVQLWPILQDIHQLRATYGRRAGSFLSNAGVLQVFGANDHDSARLISDLLGHETVIFDTVAQSLDPEKTGLSYSQHHAARPLLTPDEVRCLAGHLQILFISGRRPILADKLRYFADREFAGLYAAKSTNQ
jgi:type IV secretion system protein VirD4